MKNLLVNLIAILLLISCGKGSDKIKPTVESISESVYASGIIKSKNQYEVYTTVPGLIEEIFVSEGDSVDVDTPILSISSEASKLNAENAKLAAEFSDVKSNTQKLNEMQLAIDLAGKKLHSDSLLFLRQQKLWAEKIGSKLELEQRELAYQNSMTVYESSIYKLNDLKKQIDFTAEQSMKNLKISRTILGDYLIKSKIKGTVYSLLKEKGEMINTQIPIAVIGDSKDFILEMQVDEFDIVSVQKGKKVFVTLDSYKGELFEAIVSKINPLMNERSKTFTIEAIFSKQPPVLYPNLTLEASILISTKENTLTIPRKYVFENEYVIKSNGDKVKVVIGLKDYQKVEILSGLNKDDELIIPEN